MSDHFGGEPANGAEAAHDFAGGLAFLEPDEARRLADRCTRRQFAAGEVLLAPGTPGPGLGFVLEGKVAVNHPSMFPGRFTLLAEIEPGGMVGEGGLVTGEEHGVTVTATMDTRLLLLSREQFSQLCHDDMPLALKLMTRIIKVMRHRLHSAGERLSRIL